jgi:uroporphyrinogen-III synthase
MAHNPAPQILLSRPAAQSAAYKATLEAEFGARVSVILSPLLEIQYLTAEVDLHAIARLLFTSVNGVEAFTRLTPRRNISALCVGARTAKAAQLAGFETRSANGSAGDLVALAKTCAGPFLYPRGVHMAHDIAADLRVGGHQVEEVISYDQRPLNLTSHAMAVLANDAPCLVPLFSPRTARLFMGECRGIVLQDISVICISQNVADQLDPARFEGLKVAKHPTAKAVTREIAATL